YAAELGTGTVIQTIHPVREREAGVTVGGFEEAELLKVLDGSAVSSPSCLLGIVLMMEVEFHFPIARRREPLQDTQVLQLQAVARIKPRVLDRAARAVSVAAGQPRIFLFPVASSLDVFARLELICIEEEEMGWFARLLGLLERPAHVAWQPQVVLSKVDAEAP